MARYRFAVPNNSIVEDTEAHVFIPVDAGGWQGDIYREWLAEGNVPDPYVGPDVP